MRENRTIGGKTADRRAGSGSAATADDPLPVLKSTPGSVSRLDTKMVFFNYATMQMAAKIVYYGPGLCGKTTNLHHIYGRTAPDSRGEMVSLETETDRTLFFDLLPLDVGVISGFKTRVQLYTVPGQVFYNTTRKLVLKGVDGIVFVADSQRAMREANFESLANLRANLAEISLNLDEIPLVLQYNKRDLASLLSVDELQADLNPDGANESYEASALLGQGVFETLKAVSRITLRSLKKRMVGEERPSRPTVAFAPPPPKPESPVAPPRPPAPAASAREEGKPPGSRETVAFTPPEPVPEPPRFTPPELAPARPRPGSKEVPAEIDYDDTPPRPTVMPREEAVEEIADVSFAQSGEPSSSAESGVKHVRVGSNVDILAELERLRKNATSLSPALKPTRRAASGISVDDLLANSLNHRKEVSRVYDLEIPRRELASGEQVTVRLSFNDRNNKPVGEEKTFTIPLETQDLEKLLLSLKFQIFGK
jgi:mutual gliding-motility protein MglA